MERIKQSLTKEYLPVRLDLNDLREIEHILEGTKQFEIVTGNSKCDSVDDLVQHFKSRTIQDTKIKTLDPHVTIELQPMGTRLYVSSDDAPTAGLYHKLDSVLTGARRKPAILYSYPGLWVINTLMFAAPSLIKQWMIGSALSGLWFIWFMRVLYIRM